MKDFYEESRLNTAPDQQPQMMVSLLSTARDDHETTIFEGERSVATASENTRLWRMNLPQTAQESIREQNSTFAPLQSPLSHMKPTTAASKRESLLMLDTYKR